MAQSNGHMEGAPNGTTNGDVVDGEQVPKNWIPIREEVLWEPSRRVKVISIGAGFSGLTMANKIQNIYKLDKIIEHVIYEKNEAIGGTWYENRYPGIMCDVPAHIYTLLNLPNPDWPRFYASGSDIQEYLTKVTKEHNLDRDAHFNAKVIEAIWDEGNGNWNLKVQQGDNVIEDSCDVLINGSGVLNAWSWPEITGLRDFQGHLCHSADWQKGYDFAGKKVAVVGNGSSGIQIVPELAKVASQLTNFARSPTYVSAPFVEDLCKDPGSNPEYTQEEKDEFRRNPEKHKKYRKKLIHAFNHYYAALIEGSAPNLEAKRRTKELMEQRLKGHPELMKLTIPEWSLGCRRLTPGNGYLESFLKDHVDLVASNIVEITPKGILCADGKERHFDAIVCATGFDVSFRPRWLQVGRNGRILADEYAQDAKSYFSIATTGQPNHFIFNGPAGPVGHGSLSSAIDWEADYILKWIQKMAKEDIKSFDVKPEVQDDWNVWGDQLLKRTVWATPCRSWFKNGTVNGRISALYPGSILHFKDILQDIRGEDFDITYRSKNRWKFLGNGFTQREMEDGDLGYYLEH